jgi:hypothetical protein
MLDVLVPADHFQAMPGLYELDQAGAFFFNHFALAHVYDFQHFFVRVADGQGLAGLYQPGDLGRGHARRDGGQCAGARLGVGRVF